MFNFLIYDLVMPLGTEYPVFGVSRYVHTHLFGSLVNLCQGVIVFALATSEWLIEFLLQSLHRSIVSAVFLRDLLSLWRDVSLGSRFSRCDMDYSFVVALAHAILLEYHLALFEVVIY